MSVFERLRRANPVPDENRLLAAPDAMDAFVLSVKERSGLVGDIRDKPVEVKDPAPIDLRKDLDQTAGPVVRRSRKRYGWLVAAGAAAVTILVVGTLALLSDSTRDPGAPPATSDEVAVVVSAYDALNAGDIDAWLKHFTDDAAIFGGTKKLMGDLYEVLSSANYRTEAVEPCRRMEPTPQGEAQVECTISETNDFHAAGGLSVTRKELFVVNEDGEIAEAGVQVVALTQPGYFVFNQAFFDWLRAAHPDVHAEIRPQIGTHLPLRPEHMRTALEYLDEFIAQSDTFPIPDGS